MDLLPEDVIGRIIDFIHSDERRPLASVNRTWFKRKFLSNSMLTYHSLTSPALLRYYRVKDLSYLTVKGIIEAGGSYDFYNTYLNKIRSLSNNGYKLPNVMLDDSRYITKNNIEGILKKEAAMKIHPNMIGHGKPIELYHLEDYGLYMDNIDRKEYVYILNRDNVLRCCAKYDNVRVMPMMLYDKCDCLYHIIELGAIQCLKYVMDIVPDDQCRHITKPKSVHANVIAYIIDNWRIMEDYVGIETLLSSEAITPNLVVRLGLKCYKEHSINMCNPAIVHIKKVRRLLTADSLYSLRINWPMLDEPIELKRKGMIGYSIDELVNILTYPSIFKIHEDDLPTLLRHALPTLDDYKHDVDQFMAKYDELKDRKWSGIIIDPMLYKRLVVKHWRYYYRYIGPIDDSMRTLKFKKSIGDPLFGGWPLNKLPSKLMRPLTGHEKRSIIEHDRLDMIYRYGITSLKFKYSGYFYRSYYHKKLSPYLVDMRSIHIPPHCIPDDVTEKMLITRINKNISVIHRCLLPLNTGSNMRLDDLLEVVDLKSIKLSTTQLYNEIVGKKQANILTYGPNAYNHLKHMIDPRLMKAIDTVLRDRSIQTYE